MEKLNNLLEKVASPLKGYSNCLLKLGLGISFFLHGYSKLPNIPENLSLWDQFISLFVLYDGLAGWLTSKGVPLAKVVAPLVAWAEILAGLGILLGGLIGIRAVNLGNVVTRLSGGAIGIIMIGAIVIAHSDWAIFTGERGAVLFASEQLFLLILGVYFAIRGND